VNLAIDHVTVHADDVGGGGGIGDEHVLGRKGAIADLMHLIAAHRSGAGEDDGVPDVVLLDHALNSSQQVGVILKAQHEDLLELAGDGVDVGNLVAVRFGVVGRIGGGVQLLAAGLLGAESAGESEQSYSWGQFSHEIMVALPHG